MSDPVQGPAPRPPSRPGARIRRRGRRAADPIRPWARRLRQRRPGLVEFVLDGVEGAYGRPGWQRVHDPTSELVLTILSQNSADVNAEQAFAALRAAYPGEAVAASGAREAVAPSGSGEEGPGWPGEGRANRPGWGGRGIERTAPPDWLAVEVAPLDELIEAIRPGGLARQKAPVIQAALRRTREQRGDHSLEFLAQLPPLQARDWLTSIPGIGKKTASVVLLFAFGMPLMPVDRHVERVSKRIGLLPPDVGADEAHDRYLALLQPEQCYRLHVGLITHGRQTCLARRPACDRCPIAPRCRYVDRQAP